MPWKNGLGSTTQLLVEPASGSLETGFLWRLSMAAVVESGPFSRFGGLDRTLLLLEGARLRVDHGPMGSAMLASPLDACRFQGEWETTGTLLAGPCRDFNVMSDRSRVRHAVAVLRPGTEPEGLPAAGVRLLFCVRGRARVPGLGEILGPHDLLRADGEGPLSVEALEPGTALISVAIEAIGVAPAGLEAPCLPA